MFYGKQKTKNLYDTAEFSVGLYGATSTFISGTSDQVLNPFLANYIDSYNAFNLTSGEYTIPVSGRWFFNFNFTCNDNLVCYFSMRKNGSVISDYTAHKDVTSASYWTTAFLFTHVKCVIGDVIDIYITSNTGANYDCNGMFSGMLIV